VSLGGHLFGSNFSSRSQIFHGSETAQATIGAFLSERRGDAFSRAVIPIQLFPLTFAGRYSRYFNHGYLKIL
jgi:hypothetical protein